MHDPRTATLWWVDILSGALHSLSSTGEHEVIGLEPPLGAVALRAGGGLVAASGRSIVLLDAGGKPDGAPVRLDFDDALRFNDGAVDPAGRFVIGTASTDGRRGTAALLALEPTGGVRVVVDGVTESNGLGWSADAGVMYYVDSGEQAIRTYAYDVDLAVAKRGDDLAVVDESAGVPDGLVVDAEGCVWVALWGGGAVRRYAPDGALLEHIPTPVSQPTCLVVVDAGELYLTSGWEGLSGEAKDREPWAGHLLRRNVGATARPPALYAG